MSTEAAPSGGDRVLVQIHTFNDALVIDETIRAVRNQSRPVPEILLVDNHSTDATLERPFPDGVTVIRHPENRGTNGSVITGFRYALEQGYDWIYVLDADSVPRPDALEQIFAVYSGFSAEQRRCTRVLSSLPVDEKRGQAYHGIVFQPDPISVFSSAKPDPDVDHYECDSTIWSGSLFSTDSIRAVGLPPEDYVLDWGDHEYGYHGRKRGFRTWVCTRSIIQHDLHAMDSMQSVRLGTWTVTYHTDPPIRRYYFYRNLLYFVLYEFRESTSQNLRAQLFCGYRLLVELVKVACWSRERDVEVPACLRGIWDGLNKQLQRRF